MSATRLYLSVAAACFVLAWLLALARSAFGEPAPLSLITPDGFAYYGTLPSLWFDGDLDLSNQVRTALGNEGERWMLSGLYPLGVTLTLVPAFLLGHGLTWIALGITGSELFALDGFSLLYQLCCVAFICGFWGLSMASLHRLLVRRFALAPGAARNGILLYWLGSFFLWYLLTEPFWAHVLSSTWVVWTVVLVDHTLQRTLRGEVSARLWLLTSATASMAAITRVTNVFLAPCALALLWQVHRSGLWTATLRCLPAMALGVLPVLLQLWVWGLDPGDVSAPNPQAVGYSEDEKLVWGDPVFVPMLFSSLNGLFFWSPILLLAAYGWIRRLLTGCWRDPLLLALTVSALLLTYLNACWTAWYFGLCIGHRASLELGVVFAMGLAFFCQRLGTRRPAARRRAWILAAALVLVGHGLVCARFVRPELRPLFHYAFEWEKELYDGIRR